MSIAPFATAQSGGAGGAAVSLAAPVSDPAGGSFIAPASAASSLTPDLPLVGAPVGSGTAGPQAPLAAPVQPDVAANSGTSWSFSSRASAQQHLAEASVLTDSSAAATASLDKPAAGASIATSIDDEAQAPYAAPSALVSAAASESASGVGAVSATASYPLTSAQTWGDVSTTLSTPLVAEGITTDSTAFAGSTLPSNGTHADDATAALTTESESMETTQLSSSSIVAITVPLVLVALGLVALALMTLVNRRRARRRSGSRSGPDLFDKEASLDLPGAAREDSQSRWYALGLGLGDAKATREAREANAGRTPHWFINQGRWMTGIAGGSLSSVDAPANEGHDGRSEKSGESMWRDPFRRYSDEVTVTPHPTRSIPCVSSVTTQTFGYGASHPSQASSQAMQAEVGGTGNAHPGDADFGPERSEHVEAIHPEALLARPSTVRSNPIPGGMDPSPLDILVDTCSAHHHRPAHEAASTDYFGVTRRSMTAVGGFTLGSDDQSSCGCRAPVTNSFDEFRTYQTTTRADSSKSYTSSPIPRRRASLSAQGVDALNPAATLIAEPEKRLDSGSRIREWRRRALDEADEPKSRPEFARQGHKTPPMNDPPPTLSPMSNFDNGSSSDGGSSDRYDGSNTSDTSSYPHFITLGSPPSLSLRQQALTHSFDSRQGFASAPRSPSVDTESMHPRRLALLGTRSAETFPLTSASIIAQAQMKRYTPSAISGSFVTARSGSAFTNLPDSHPFATVCSRPPTTSVTSTNSPERERGRLDSVSTIRPAEASLLCVKPPGPPRKSSADTDITQRSRATQDTRSTDECASRRTDGTGMTLPSGWGAAPRRRARIAGHGRLQRSVHAKVLGEEDDDNRSDVEVGRASSFRGEGRCGRVGQVVREKTRKGEAWERSVLSGRF